MPRGVGEQIAKELIIAVLEEQRLAPVAARRHVVRNAGENDTREPSHGDGYYMSSLEYKR